MLDEKTDSLRALFEGVWRIERQIDDQASGSLGSFHGHARLWRSLDGLAYHETGELAFAGGSPMLAERKYVWQIQHQNVIDVFFDDGRYFHSFNPTGSHWQTEHICSPDRYEVSYDFASPTRWQSSWNVSGPRKRYRLTSVFTR